MFNWSIFMAFFDCFILSNFPGTVVTLNIFYWILKESFCVGGVFEEYFKTETWCTILEHLIFLHDVDTSKEFNQQAK